MVDKVEVPAEESFQAGPTSENTGKPSVQEVTGRPEWLPENFDSVEKFVESYKNLRADHTRKSQELSELKKAAPEAGPEAQGDSPEMEIPKGNEDQKLRGVENDVLQDISNHAWQNGELTDEHYATLEQAGYSRELVDQFMDGQLAAQQGAQAALINAGGGAEQVQAMFDWAAKSMSDNEVQSYNSKFAQGGADALMAMEALKSRYMSSGEAPGAGRVSGANASSTETDVFASVAQVREAMSDPRYKTDPAYRESVARKLGRSNVL